jgi:hypothetical protein
MRRKLFVHEEQAAGWISVDEAILDALFVCVPTMPRRGWKLKNLDFTRSTDVSSLPSGLRCDQINLAGTSIRLLPGDLRIADSLDLHGCRHLVRLPTGLKLRDLDLRGCTSLTHLPGDLRVARLDIRGCCSLQYLPGGFRCDELVADGTALRSLPEDLQVRCNLSLCDCRKLAVLPTGLRVSVLDISGCTALQALPLALDVFDLKMERCTTLIDWPPSARVTGGRVLAAGCSKLVALSPQLTDLEVLDVRDCPSLTEIPRRLRVREWIDIANTRIRELPMSMRGVTVRWRGVAISEQFAFHPERLQTNDILRETNVERRRLYLQWFGLDRFMQSVGAQKLDADTDAGGARELLQVELPNDEPLVCISVRCPSTGRHYLLRVPPTVTSCHEAVAWTAGLDTDDYRPVMET